MKTEAKRTLPRNEVKAIVFNSYRERNTERRNLGSALKHTHPHSFASLRQGREREGRILRVLWSKIRCLSGHCRAGTLFFQRHGRVKGTSFDSLLKYPWIWFQSFSKNKPTNPMLILLRDLNLVSNALEFICKYANLIFVPMINSRFQGFWQVSEVVDLLKLLLWSWKLWWWPNNSNNFSIDSSTT